MSEELKELYTQNQFPGELFEFSFCYFCFFFRFSLKGTERLLQPRDRDWKPVCMYEICKSDGVRESCTKDLETF